MTQKMVGRYIVTEEWHGKVSREAIAEAVRLANQAF